MLAKVAALGDVASVASPYGPAGAAQISSSGQVAFANVTLDKQAIKITTSQAKQFVDTAKTGAANGVQVELEGQVAKAANPASISTIGFGAAAALVVLFLVFGSLLAATLPLLTAGIALGSSVAVIALLSHVLSMASFSSELSLLIGLGVGVDYALFIVTRFRQGLQRGKTDRAGDRRRARHLRASGHVRRDHRLHRPARHVRARRELPLRRRGRREHRRPLHRDRGADAAAGAARVLRPPRARPQGAPHARRRAADDDRRVAGLGPLGPHHPGAAGADRSRRGRVDAR